MLLYLEERNKERERSAVSKEVLLLSPPLPAIELH
jgi:hypothetical protein